MKASLVRWKPRLLCGCADAVLAEATDGVEATEATECEMATLARLT